MQHTTACQKCGITLYSSEGKRCQQKECPNIIKPQPEPDNSWALQIPLKPTK